MGYERKHKSVSEIVAESNAKRRARRANATPPPWILLKLAVFITLGIIVYATYVYIGRLCVPMLKRNNGALGSRSLAIAFLVVFCVLDVMMLWAYWKVCTISPGKARDHVQKSDPPEATTEGISYESTAPPPASAAPALAVATPQPSSDETLHPHSTHAGHNTIEKLQKPTAHLPTHDAVVDDRNAGVMNALPSGGPVPEAGVPGVSEHQTQKPLRSRAEDLPPYERQPATRPVLLPEHRYCGRDNVVKPLRTHHCRVCGTCILRYDHHCPWIGQCVGARNHRFFVLFLLWAFLFCAWTFSTLIGLNVRGTATYRGIDGQHIAIIALSGLFGIFTSTLLFSHVRLIRRNLTTVESLDVHDYQARESVGLGRMYAWYQFGAKYRAKARFDEEWGHFAREGNMWWLGNERANWESVMGHNPLGWFLPIGGPVSDGLTYPVNPRFDAQGRQRPRSEWPAELQ